jgi:hypothetical protein
MCVSDQKSLPGPNGAPRRDDVVDPAATPPGGRRSRFGAATEGWEAYNTWLTRVRQPGSTSRQAVIAKALYSVSSYRNWAEKARDAFDGEEGGGSDGKAGNGNGGTRKK